MLKPYAPRKRPILPFLTSYSISINDGGIHGVSDFSRCIAVIVLRNLLLFVSFVVSLWISLTLPAFTRAAVTYFSFACIFGVYTFAFTWLLLFCPWWSMNLYWFGLVCNTKSFWFFSLIYLVHYMVIGMLICTFIMYGFILMTHPNIYVVYYVFLFLMVFNMLIM